jgi:uncharacterized protein
MPEQINNLNQEGGKMSATMQVDFDVFCWWELGTADAMAAKEFYGDLFGWNFIDSPMPPDGIYTVLQLGDKNIAGLYKLNKTQLEQNVPPHWLSYLCVRDVTDATQKAKDLGSTILMQPFDVAEMGKMSVIQDPEGAVVALWQTVKGSGPTLMNVTGSVCWNELYVRDMNRGRDFYTRLLGWTVQDIVVNDHPYLIFKKGEKQVASMMQITPEMAGAPPHWMIYFAVADCEKTIQLATSRGAVVLFEPTQVPDVGKFAVLQDPQGAVFSVMQMAK